MSNKTNLNSIKAQGLEIVNDLSTSGTLNFSNGYLFLGESYQDDVKNESTPLPPQSYMGTSETRGNISRDVYNINTNGPIQFGGTDDDRKIVVKKYSNIVATNPILTLFPWLYPLQQEWTSNTQVALGFSKTYPIHKCLGKGLGEIEFYKVANPINGQESKVGNTIVYESKGLTCGNRQSITHEKLYPFNGKIYAGTLVELITEENPTTGIKETKVIPYQEGRGIPLYSKNYEPSTNTPLTEYAPFGELKWPETNNTISPSLASGVDPNTSNKCVGIVMDTFSSTVPNKRLFQYKEPEGFSSESLSEDPHDPWYNHPAPYTVPAVSTKNSQTVPDTQGFLSPGPNSAGTYYAPWPSYYAYQPNDPIPVLTKGITTARIGAAYNIALTSYGLRQQISATDESWIPVTSIPLFQGERLEAGSYIYSSVKGMLMTVGADVTERRNDYISGTSTYPVGLLGQIPWDFFVDSTWGNIGWCGTPGLSFTNIPDSTTAILEILKDQEGNVKNIPFLNQSNQGSIIVHPVSNVQPDPALGNSYLQRLSDNVIEGLTEQEKYNIRINRFNLPGVSGRCMLPQPAPDKCQPIGIMLETIIGQGKWPYNNLPLTFYEDPTVLLQNGGVTYREQPSTPINIPVRGGTGAGMEVSWSSYNAPYPFLGTITENPTVSVVGAGYVDGDIVTIKDNTTTYNPVGPQYKGNNAAFTLSVPANTLEFNPGGSGYGGVTLTGSTFNASRNNIYLNFVINFGGFVFYTPGSQEPNPPYLQDYNFYPNNTYFEILEQGVSSQDTAVFRVINAQPTNVTLESKYSGGGTYTPAGAQVMETNVIDYNFRNPTVVYTQDSTTNSVTGIKKIVDYGAGNKEGDLLILTNPTSDQNAVFSYPGLPPGIQEITHSSSNYPNNNVVFTTQYNTYIGSTTTTDGVIAVLTKQTRDRTIITSELDSTDILYFSEEILPINAIPFSGGPAPTPNTIYQVYQAPLTTGSLDVPSPNYVGRRLTIWNNNTGDFKLHAGGTNYTTATNVSCYNLTANNLRLYYNVLNNQIVNGPNNDIPVFLSTRYTFGADDGTELRLLDDTVPVENQQVIKLLTIESPVPADNRVNLTTEVVTPGSTYGDLTDGLWAFNTQRTDQVNPTVDIEIRTDTENDYPTGTVGYVRLRTAGTNNQKGDLILVTQEGSDLNCVFLYDDNRPLINLPPFAKRPGYKVDDSQEAWKKYSDVMSSAVNLMDKEVLVELRPTTSSTMETVYPAAQACGMEMPNTNNEYQSFY